MFENIGKKIKSLVVIIARIEFALFIIIGLSIIFSGRVLLGLLLGGIGCLFAWLSAFFVYAFGEMVDKLQDIERNTRLISQYTSISAHYQKNNANKD